MSKLWCAVSTLTFLIAGIPTVSAQPQQGTWTVTGTMQSPREFAAQKRLGNGNLLAIGGVDNNSNVLASAEIYKPGAGTWVTTGSMVQAREFFAAVVLTSGKVLVVGGLGTSSIVLQGAELYNPSTGTWSSAGELSVPRYGHTATLLEVAANPKRFGAEIGFLCVLHTWGQTLVHHPHLHCVVPAGGFAPGGAWLRPKRAGWFLPKPVLSEVFRGKFYDGLKALFRQKKLSFEGSLSWLAEPRSFARFLQTLHRHQWVVDVRKPFGGPEHVLHYLARYTHRVAISNHRLIGLEDGKVTFRWKDYAHGGKKKKMTLDAAEFIRRFLLHVLPKGLVRIRYYGWMANRCRRERAAQCRALLEVSRLSWKWRGRSAVKITERTREKDKKALHLRREGRRFETAFAGAGAGVQAL